MSTARSIHYITHSHLAWDNSIPPVARVQSGDIVDFDCVDASNGQITFESSIEALATFDKSRLDQVNGPVYVEEAEAGDVLEVEVLNVQTANWGWTAILPNFGLLSEEFTEPHLKIWKIEQGDEATGEEGYAMFKPGIKIPIAPFCGEMGLAPAELGAKSTIPPYFHGRFGFDTDFFLSYTWFFLICHAITGGNMDTKHITKGSKLYLPVQVKGALFSLGDGHAAQGDGECCGTLNRSTKIGKHHDINISFY